jgi:predicted regulator of Ras-like GTPase activity (Roadblock/LC7/MglB family)
LSRFGKTKRRPLNSEIVLAEYTSLLRSARRVGDELLFDRVRELTDFRRTRSRLLCALVNSDYYLAMVLETSGNFGRGRYELVCAEMILLKELAL